METKNHVLTSAEVKKTETIIKNHVLIAMGFGAVPIPFVDMAGITATQISMISKLAAEYQVQFSHELGKTVLVSLLSGVGAQSLATGTLGSLVKAIPLVGSIVGAVTYSAIGGSTTYAVGKVFARHFEMGGNLLNFKASDAKSYFKEELDKGRDVVKSVKETVKKPFTKKTESDTVEE
ncbi:MAG: hypothetical protein B7X86_01160 [Sphingobacteriales bacterium 17-39-43]|uniref:YcjF family protein n=1 Tax=Daejeonella sp. TaxID=2805397 RepID=UPI000BC9A5C5|nr:DUF697 domain-containing protein [Daejeonella sp.]OYZ32975.1 MAG: hypothetical protein B7Y24_01165 [Sphingobacteriales bacterium 16-39-50]OZA26385.1 MAG: hypothetical protein B7X86_01160 [Sphingobacteriales bacterium 17-39-43]HQT21516.1 DUF697 domain-containing protein [Daejeonella sp.]HQT56247.1 DUF697 domain-containing protein [Daejeonella sp.]